MPQEHHSQFTRRQRLHISPFIFSRGASLTAISSSPEEEPLYSLNVIGRITASELRSKQVRNFWFRQTSFSLYSTFPLKYQWNINNNEKKDNSCFSKPELSSLSNILSVCWKQMVSIHSSVHSSFKYKFMVFFLLFIGGRDVRWFNFSFLFHLPFF